jgi:hypothetical protein
MLHTITPPPLGHRLVELDTLRELYRSLSEQRKATAAMYDDMVHQRREGNATAADVDAAWETYLDAHGQFKGLVAFLEATNLMIDVLI